MAASTPPPLEFGFLLMPGFSLMTWACAVEPLRQVNRLARDQLCRWRSFSGDGAPVTASAGAAIVPDARIGDRSSLEYLFVVAGLEVDTGTPGVLRWLRSQARRGTVVGALSTGTFVLAEAGLLRGVPCTVHWESVDALRERHPTLEVTGRLYEVGRDRITCAGASATLDLMLHLIGRRFGVATARAVANQYNYPALRLGDSPQLTSGAHASLPAKLSAAMSLLEASIERPLSTSELAARLDLSTRHLNRLFNARVGMSGGQWFRRARLRRAWVLLTQTALPVLEVAIACGYRSGAAFAREYRSAYGEAPRDTRRKAAARGATTA